MDWNPSTSKYSKKAESVTVGLHCHIFVVFFDIADLSSLHAFLTWSTMPEHWPCTTSSHLDVASFASRPYAEIRSTQHAAANFHAPLSDINLLNNLQVVKLIMLPSRNSGCKDEMLQRVCSKWL